MARKTPRDYRLEMKMGDPRKIETEDYKRSSHNDFATTSELRERNYSGYRMNSITQTLEIWVRGTLRAEVPAPNGQPDEEAVQAAFNRVFGVE